MANRDTLGGIIHTYQQYDPQRFPSPSAPPPDVTGSAMEHLLMYGDMREFTDEELANAIHLGPEPDRRAWSELAGDPANAPRAAGKDPERRTNSAVRAKRPPTSFTELAASIKPPKELAGRFGRAVQDEQLRELERLFYAHNKDQSPFANSLVQLVDRLGSKYQIDQMSGKYEFTGNDIVDACRKRSRSAKSSKRSTASSSKSKKPRKRRSSRSSTWKRSNNSPSRAT